MKEVLRYDIETLSAQMATGKRILSYEIWQHDLPRTTTRKLKRHEILKAVERKQEIDGAVKHEERPLTDDEQQWLAKPMVQQAIAVIASAAKGARKIHPQDNLELELGLDSMERVELVVALESALQAQADPNMISEVYTVRELVEAVIAGRGTTPGPLRTGWEEVFKRESTDPDVVAILEPRPIAVRLWYAFGCVVSLFCKIAFRLETRGLEKLPPSGPFVLSPNHQSFLDGPIVASQMPFRLYREMFYVGTSEIFGSGFMRKLAHSIKLIPVDPDANLVPAMKAGAFGLAHGKILVLYPEGERSIDGDLKMFKKGAAILAVHHNVPIYPVALEGFHEVWPRGRAFRSFGKLR
ncbi:MAG: 1-acyl-sn-glycerol-3-phosphate acyltransferase, partial [Terriglobales bacterium]